MHPFIGRRFDIGGQRTVAQHVAGDAQRTQQRHAIAQQRAQRARKPCGFQFTQQAADAAPLQQPAIQGQAEGRLPGLAFEEQREHGRHHQQQHPPVAHEQAQLQHRVGEPRQRHVQAFVHLRELRHHVAEQEQQRATYHHQQDRRIDQRIDHLALQRAAAFQVIGQALQGFMQAAAGFAGTHHVHVQARKQAVLAFQRGGQRRTAAHHVADVGDGATRSFILGQPEQDRQRAVQRLAGTEQGRQLLGELQQRGALQRALAQQVAPAAATDRATIGQLRFHRQVALVLQARDQFGLAGRFHLPVEDLAVRIEGPVAIGRHVSPGVLRASAFLGHAQHFLDGGLPAQRLGQATFVHGAHAGFARDALDLAHAVTAHHRPPQRIVHHQEFHDGGAAEVTGRRQRRGPGAEQAA
ncbi:hypothetical protein G6F68_010798 [Rhizopus microsporus]|nr:hypothetical protein G6F68_010798 [Rhizopus microsporus]